MFKKNSDPDEIYVTACSKKKQITWSKNKNKTLLEKSRHGRKKCCFVEKRGRGQKLKRGVIQK